MTLRRFSSRTKRLDREFLAKSLEGATRYLRIAGYFRSSIFELVGEEISRIPEVKIVCNSELDMADFQVATGRTTALKERWNEVDVEAEALLKKERYQILDKLLKSGNVEIRVVPRERLFLHGKAGSIHYPDGTRSSFIGSVVDLPWNPSRLEQRLGRIKRFGQSRKFVDMLNLVYSDTQDEKIYNVLSERLKDTYDIFGSLPDTIDDEWIQNEAGLKEKMDFYIHERKNAEDAFSVKYRSTLDPESHLWERCAEVLSRRDIVNALSEPW